MSVQIQPQFRYLLLCLAAWEFVAAKLAMPRALLGVMIAEWLATERGLGNLMNKSRGFLDYGMIWTVAIVSVLTSLVFYQAIVLVERRWRCQGY